MPESSEHRTTSISPSHSHADKTKRQTIHGHLHQGISTKYVTDSSRLIAMAMTYQWKFPHPELCSWARVFCPRLPKGRRGTCMHALAFDQRDVEYVHFRALGSQSSCCATYPSSRWICINESCARSPCTRRMRASCVRDETHAYAHLQTLLGTSGGRSEAASCLCASSFQGHMRLQRHDAREAPET
jgi:hypothetical protein